jgi:GNAT superfamily N-acetyltransferase
VRCGGGGPNPISAFTLTTAGFHLLYSSLVLSIRRATIDDAALLRAMIRELAEFERELEFCTIEEADLARDGFGENPKFHALIAECDGRSAGYAVFFECYSTWQGAELYLEDLFVRPQFRGRKIGMKLLSAVARIAVEQNCRAMRWEVLDWNENAIALYKSLGAEFRHQWKSVLLTQDGLKRLAERT